MQRQQEKLSSIIYQEANSESAKLISKAVEQYGDSYILLKKLEAQKTIAKNLSQ